MQRRMRASAVVGTLVHRSLLRLRRIPAAIIPTVAFPLFMLLSFSGAYRSVTAIPGFPTDNILNWVAPYAIIQGGAFAGAGAAYATAVDIENGFHDRLMLSPASRVGLLLGPTSAAAVRVLLPFVLVVPAAFLGGAELTDGPLGLIPLLVAGLGAAVLGALWGLGVVYRLKTQRSAALVQVGIFVTMFLSVGQAPLSIMQGWLHTVATLNPMTQVLDLAREGFLGEMTWGQTWPGLTVIVVGGALFGTWALRGLDRLTA
jgi:ABC-type multidrug transport system permease subunit